MSLLKLIAFIIFYLFWRTLTDTLILFRKKYDSSFLQLIVAPGGSGFPGLGQINRCDRKSVSEKARLGETLLLPTMRPSVICHSRSLSSPAPVHTNFSTHPFLEKLHSDGQVPDQLRNRGEERRALSTCFPRGCPEL